MYRQSVKKLVNIDTSSTCPHNMANFSLLTAETCWRVWGTPSNFNGFRALAVLLHGTLVVGVSQTLRHSTEGATSIWQGGHHVGHWPTFLVSSIFPLSSSSSSIIVSTSVFIIFVVGRIADAEQLEQVACQTKVEHRQSNTSSSDDVDATVVRRQAVSASTLPWTRSVNDLEAVR